MLVGYQAPAWWFTGRTYGDLVIGLRAVNFRARCLRLVGSFALAPAGRTAPRHA